MNDTTSTAPSENGPTLDDLLAAVIAEQDALSAALDSAVGKLGGEDFLAQEWGTGNLPTLLADALAAELGEPPLTAAETATLADLTDRPSDASRP